MHFQINPLNSSNTNFEDFLFLCIYKQIQNQYETPLCDFRRRRRFIGRL